MNISALLRKYNKPVPRYTSYPTAVHFNHEISQGDYRGFISALDEGRPVSLYLHIPFCHVLCHYCGCHTKVANSYGPVKSYVQNLLQEIKNVGETLTCRPPISQLHFGGGSPNFLEQEEIAEILSTLRQYFDFGEKPEIAMETDPRLMTEKKIKGLADLGFTRVSLGVQDFNKDVQEAINRVQSFEMVQDSVLNLRASGIDKINFDLMVGLPLQTLDGVKSNVEKAISLSPDRLAVFAYAHVPWMKKHQKLLEKYEMPDTNLRFDMMVLVKEMLEEAGYHSIGIDHFAREEDSLYRAYKGEELKRNFQGYTDDPARTIIGFGLSSISMFDGAYVQNMTDAPAYRKAVEGNEFPVLRGCMLSAEDKKRRMIIEDMMCGRNVNIADYPEAQGALALLAQDGLVSLYGDNVKITPKGWPFSRLAAACFDEYYEPQEGQHARAI